MSGFCQKAVLALLTLAVVGVTPVWADEFVARITKISENGTLEYQRGGSKWYPAFIDMKDQVDDKLKTDATTFGSIEFFTGGQIGINKNSAVQITADNDVNVISVSSGGIWAKMGKQKKPLQIRTSSGVMGIKGTEFVVTETGDGTEVSVLEGEVEVTPADGGEPQSVLPGTKVLLKLKAVEVVKQGEPEDLREEILESQEWEDFNEALRWARFITAYVPGASLGGAGYYASMGVGLVNNPEQAAANYAASRVGGPAGGLIRMGMSRRNEKKEPDFPSKLAPDHQANSSSAIASSDLRFAWKGLDDAEKYVILVGKDEEMNELVWSGRTRETNLVYPSNAKPLAEGKYFWRVIGLNGDDEPVGKASQTWFQAAAPPVEEPPAEEATEEAPSEAASE